LRGGARRFPRKSVQRRRGRRWSRIVGKIDEVLAHPGIIGGGPGGGIGQGGGLKP